MAAKKKARTKASKKKTAKKKTAKAKKGRTTGKKKAKRKTKTVRKGKRAARRVVRRPRKKRDPNKKAPTGARYSDDLKARAAELAKKGRSVPEIHEILRPKGGPTKKTIRVWLDGMGIEPESGRPRQYDRTKILEDLEALDEEGDPLYSRSEICEKYGCSQKFVSDLIHGKIAP